MKSANASVTGPAAILGSRLNRCRSEGTARPSAHAVTSESAMLPPITVAARRSSRHTQAMTQTTNPQETDAKGARRRYTTDLFKPKTERLERLRADRHSPATARSILCVACFQNFLGKQIRVDDSNHAALFVNDRESEEFVEHEELARVEHRCVRRNSHDAPHH